VKNWTLISRVLGLGLGIRVLGLGLGLEAQVLVNITVYSFSLILFTRAQNWLKPDVCQSPSDFVPGLFRTAKCGRLRSDFYALRS